MAVINIIKPLDPPILVSVFVEAGTGDWDEGTYHFVVCNMELTTRAFPGMLSPFSNVITKTLNNNDKVTLNYSNTTGAGLMMLYFKNGESQWLISYTSVNTQSYPSSFIPSHSSFGKNYTVLENFAALGYSYFGLDVSKGVGKVEITGTGNFYASDINNAFNDSSIAIEGEDYLDMKDIGVYTTYCFDGTNADIGARFQMTGGEFYFYGGYDNVGGCTLTATASPKAQTRIYNPQRGGYFQGIKFDNCELNYCAFGVGFNSPILSNGSQFQFYGGYVKNSIMCGTYDTISEYWSDSIWYVASMRIAGVESFNMNFHGSYLYPQCGAPCILTECKIYTLNTNYQIFYLPNSTTGIPTFIDCGFYDETSGNKYKYNQLKFWSHNYYSKVGTLEFYNTLQLQLKDKSNTEIEGANIQVSDNLGNTYSFTSDSSGQVDELLKVFRHDSSLNAAPGLDGIDYNHNPFKIEIAKDGYDSIKYDLNIQDKIDWQISMIETTPPVYIDRDIQGSFTPQEILGFIKESQLSGIVTTFNLHGSIDIDT